MNVHQIMDVVNVNRPVQTQVDHSAVHVALVIHSMDSGVIV